LHWPQIYLTVALTTLATLLLELSLTRIFSVVFYYHFAFLAISIALFGLGAGGVFSYVVAGWKGRLFSKLGWLSALNSVLVILALIVALGQKDQDTAALAVIYFTTALPFFVSGAIVSLAISETIERVNRVYFFDLLGAAGGCIFLVPLLNHFGGPNTVLAAAVLFAVAASVWHSMAGSVPGRVASVGLALAIVVLIFLNARHSIVDVHYAKGQAIQREQFVKWNSFSRVAIVPEKNSNVLLIRIDADASTGIAPYDFDRLSEQDRAGLLRDGPGLPYVVRPGAKALVIGCGGGWDIARALASGSRDVTGVEINPIIADTIMRKRFPQLSHRLYFRPEVHVFVDEGRSFVRRSTDQYQVIQATLVDTWASTAAGAFALSENNLYTTEAFRDYLVHLSDDGFLAFTRWGFDPPRESLRLISLAIEALRDLGESDPWRHIIVARENVDQLAKWGATDTVLISRKPFAPADVERARAALANSRMQALYLPGQDSRNAFSALLHSPDARRFERDYPFDITPVTDNRPFFFYSVQPRDILAFLRLTPDVTADYKINKAVPLLFELMAISIAATLVILALPPVLLRTRLPRQPGVARFLLYFLCIGAAYIMIEVALIQKLVLFLGHPTYALTVVIFSMLLSSGIGSYFSRTVVGESMNALVRVLIGIAALVALLAFLVTVILAAGVGLPLAAKVLITVVLIFPAGFLMGMPFPTGLALLEQWHKPSLRWAWSLNAASSVLGSVGALVCAIYLGFLQTLLIGGLLYLAAMLVASAGKSGVGTSDLVFADRK
jgi:SAM-dependent methyltransferase